MTGKERFCFLWKTMSILGAERPQCLGGVACTESGNKRFGS